MQLTLKRRKGIDIIDARTDIAEDAVVRTIISLPEKDKAWLDKQAKERKVPMASLVREAIALLKLHDSVEKRRHFKDVLKRSAGIWKNGDGLEWQRKLRDEWR